MSMGAQEAPGGFFKRLKQERRTRLKRFGKRLIRRLGGFIGRQSLVGDAPVLDSNHFPFLTQFTDNWEPIRAEVEEIFKHRDQIPKSKMKKFEDRFEAATLRASANLEALSEPEC